jgi:hypothetical protein
MYPGGTLILLAYLELLLDRYPGRIEARCKPHSLPAQLMRHFGIADRLGLSPELSRPTHDSVVNWHYLTGTVADGSKIAQLLETYRQLSAARIPEGLYEALTEALTNVRQHAYPEGTKTPNSLRRWWLFAKYEEPIGSKTGSLYIGVYDIGIGIQRSMRQRLKPGEMILGKAGEWLDWTGIRGTTALLDRLLLHAAVERNRSSTGQSFRGIGLQEMRDFVRGTASGVLSIVSGLAQYTCNAKTDSSAAFPSKDPILGTLIVWNIPLESMPQSP